MSVSDTIQDGVVALLVAGQATFTVKRRKAGIKFKIDTMPLCLIEGGPITDEENVFGVYVIRRHTIRALLGFAGNQLLESGFSTMTNAEQLIRGLMLVTTISGSLVWMSEMASPVKPYDRSMLDKNYEWGVVEVDYKTTEPRNN